jgi:hypothetical protein
MAVYLNAADNCDEPLPIRLCSVNQPVISPQIGSLNLSHIWTHPGLQGQCRVTARRITTARIYTYMDSSRPASRKWMMSNREPRASMRPLVGERPPGPDGMRSLSPQRPHGICVPRIEPGCELVQEQLSTPKYFSSLCDDLLRAPCVSCQVSFSNIPSVLLLPLLGAPPPYSYGPTRATPAVPLACDTVRRCGGRPRRPAPSSWRRPHRPY